ncbi:MAG: hypothetical protein HYY23_14645 [Verrucomicrobia bacterium]|nr:hypothetical protein [Verrucomicrobiota bacterium]
MSETLTIRVPDGEKAHWEKAAAKVKETVAEYVRKAVRQRAQAGEVSPWEKHLASADVAVPAPTNANIRRAFSERRRHKA